jgi:hypothetical protein
MTVRYRLGSVLWIIAILAVALGWLCDRRRLERQHLRQTQELESRHYREIWTEKRKLTALHESSLEKQYQLTELLRQVNGTATED